MNDSPTLARSQSLGEGFYNSIPKETLFGRHLKDHERTSHHATVKRCCHVRISRLEFQSDTRDKLPSQVRIAVGLSKIRRNLITSPIDLTSSLEEIVYPNQQQQQVLSVQQQQQQQHQSQNAILPPSIDLLSTSPNGGFLGGNPSQQSSSGSLENNINNNNSNGSPNHSPSQLVGSIPIPIKKDQDAHHVNTINISPLGGKSPSFPPISPRSKKDEVSHPMQSPNTSTLPTKKVYCYPMNIRISFHYDHALKEYDDNVKITLLRNIPKDPKRERRDQFAPVAYCESNLSSILQQGELSADLDMSPFQPPKISMLDNLVPISINVNICSVPKEIENIGEAEEYQLNDIALSDDENLFFDSDSFDEDEDDLDEPPQIITSNINSGFMKKESVFQPIPSTSSAPPSFSTTPPITGNIHSLNVTPSTPNTLSVTPSTSIGSTGGVPPLSARLIEESRKKMEKKSKLQKLSSLIKPSSTKPSPSYDSTSITNNNSHMNQIAEEDFGQSSHDERDLLESSNESELFEFEYGHHHPHHNHHQKMRMNKESPPSSPYHMLKGSGGMTELNISGGGKQSPNPSIEAYLNSSESPINVVLVNGCRMRGRLFLESMSERMPRLKEKYSIVATRSSSDVGLVLKAVLARRLETPVRIAIAGSDSYVNAVLKPYVQLLATRPRGMDPFLFYLLPIGKSNEIATSLANSDPAYSSLFSGDWKKILDKVDQNIVMDDHTIHDIETKLLTYLDKTNTRYSHRFQIGEALLTFPSTTSTSAIPFIKSVQIPRYELESNDSIVNSQNNQSNQNNNNNNNINNTNSSTSVSPPSSIENVKVVSNTSNINNTTSIKEIDLKKDVNSTSGGGNNPNTSNSSTTGTTTNTSTHSEQPVLKVDYWVPNKKKGEDHLEIKVPFQLVKLSRNLNPTVQSNILPSSSKEKEKEKDKDKEKEKEREKDRDKDNSGYSSSTNKPTIPTNSSFNLYVLYKEKKSKKNMLPKFGKQKKNEDKQSKEDKSSLTTITTKLMCGPINSGSSSSNSTHTETNALFKVQIDGIEIPGVKFLSVSPQWGTHIKAFNIQTFVDTNMNNDRIQSSSNVSQLSNNNSTSQPIQIINSNASISPPVSD